MGLESQGDKAHLVILVQRDHGEVLALLDPEDHLGKGVTEELLGTLVSKESKEDGVLLENQESLERRGWKEKLAVKDHLVLKATRGSLGYRVVMVALEILDLLDHVDPKAMSAGLVHLVLMDFLDPWGNMDHQERMGLLVTEERTESLDHEEIQVLQL